MSAREPSAIEALVQQAAVFKAARDLAPEQVEQWVQVGRSLAMAHEVYPAIEVFETCLHQHPTCVSADIELGALYLWVGAIPKGRQCLQQALANQPTVAQRGMIAALLREQDRLDPKRYYRPDFEALHRQSPGMSLRRLWDGVRQWWRTRKH